ncbi:hypothetical protein LUZ60_013921 [Juncus effusus]|nr:hypothetical protein LUZ60_013921 [Juncus effusus]
MPLHNFLVWFGCIPEYSSISFTPNAPVGCRPRSIPIFLSLPKEHVSLGIPKAREVRWEIYERSFRSKSIFFLVLSPPNHHDRPAQIAEVHSCSPGERPQREKLTDFFENFLSEQSGDLSSLRSAADHPTDESSLQQLVDSVTSHYEDYYETKGASAHCDVTPMFSPSWTSTTENVFMWAGGWRPTAAFHVLYSKSGLQLEGRLEEIIRGLDTDLGSLSPTQLEAVDGLQRETIKAEREISEEMAKAHEALATAEMVLTSESEDGGGMVRKREGMRNVLAEADKLRLDTIKGIVESLKPIQAVHFLIAAAELHLAVHEFGKNKDRSHERADA